MPESGWEEMGFSADDGSEKRSALSAWSGHLQTILARADGGNVVSMSGT
jgi:hypothetical protein